MERIDLLLTGGTVVDGTGAPSFRADVAVLGERLRLLRGETSAVEAERRIDISGKVVCPGFIDVHSHSGLVMLEEPTLPAKLLQGVTTEVIGVDGLSYAPFEDAAQLRAFVALNSGIDGDPALDYAWTDLGSYLERFDGRVSPNVAAFVGNTALRIAAVGWDDTPAGPAAIRRMCDALEDALDAGALGLSTGLDYPPGGYAPTDEIVALAGIAARHGGIYHTHVRYAAGDRYLDPFREAILIGRRSGIPVHVTHFSRSTRATYEQGGHAMLALVDAARSEGVETTFDTYPFEWGGTRLMRLLPDWTQEGGPDALRARLGDAAVRDRLRTEVEGGTAYKAYGTSRPFWDVRLTHFKRLMELEGRTLAEVTHDRGGHVVDTICELLLEEDLRVTFVRPSPHGPTLPDFVRHPLGMIATDSVLIGRLPSPRAFGTFPRILGDYVREERWLSLPEAVMKMTAFPAARMGLADRGLVRDGMAADLVVFDAASVQSKATYEQPRRPPVGIEHVIVNGALVVEDGRHTGRTPGRVLRRAA